jgi:hypothetical protein
MPDWSQTPRTPVFEHIDRERFDRQIIARGRPAILPGLVAHWPAVQQARLSDEALCSYLRRFSAAAPVDACFGAPEAGGRFFYADNLTRFNFERRSLPLAELLNLLLQARTASRPPHFYAGAVRLRESAPGFLEDNPSPLLDPAVDQLNSLWIGNRSRIAAHWDLPRNLICAVGGRRRYILFPPEQIGNLYPGPLDFTPAGQPVSMVDFHAPDLLRHPRFSQALQSAEIAELAPGDALYLPSLWWHHAESLDPIGVMVNYWWRECPAHAGSPRTTLLHALTTLRDLPQEERLAWRSFFDYYIFRVDGEEPAADLPEAARGVLGEMTPDLALRLHAHIVRSMQ